MSNWFSATSRRQVRHLDRDDALGLEENLQALDEVEQPRHVREHVVARDEVGFDTACAEPPRRLGAEEGHLRGNPFGDGRLRDVGGRFDAQDRHAVGQEILQQVAVVARDLDDLRLSVRAPNRSTMSSAYARQWASQRSENDEKYR